MKHTPGPWKFVPSFGRIEVEKFIVAYLSLSVEVRGNPLYLPKGEAEANGMLVAAAPDLLEALEATRNEIVSLAVYLDTCESGVILENLPTLIASLKIKQELAETAIRKAKGE